MIYAIVVLATFLAYAQAGCDNACSGHGTCGENGICQCYDNWGLGLAQYSGDCSQRICPYEIAFVDSPYLESTYRKGLDHALGTYGAATADDDTIEIGNFNPTRNGGNTAGGEPYTSVARHKYAECSGRGLCNRDSGECECFPGYEGKGCQRTACPNDCSGHGRCAYIEKMPFETTAMAYAKWSKDWSFLSQDAHTFTYRGWDRHKTRGCICDPEYGDVDCSKRMCPYGTDIMDQRNNLNKRGQYEVQTIIFEARGSTGVDTGLVGDLNQKTFALTFKSQLNETFTTNPIVFNVATGDDLHDFVLDVEQALESLPNRVIDDVKVNAAILTTGATPSISAVRLNITFSGEHVQGPQNLLTVRAYKCGDGCTPKLTGLELEPNRQFVSVGFVDRWGGNVGLATGGYYPSLKATLESPGNAGAYSSEFIDANKNIGLAMSDYNSYECGRRGKCDYSTGICGCFAGYTGIACGTVTALV
jgi:hypothetical protein